MDKLMKETKVEITPSSTISATIDVKEPLNPDELKTADQIASSIIELFNKEGFSKEKDVYPNNKKQLWTEHEYKELQIMNSVFDKLYKTDKWDNTPHKNEAFTYIYAVVRDHFEK